ncbi:MAG: hypothetical protein LBR51_00215 [Bacteroidales bacterium]|jgi:hypothetical protein|nr:hypothetical protein [Bacteroidales bacterium]
MNLSLINSKTDWDAYRHLVFELSETRKCFPKLCDDLYHIAEKEVDGQKKVRYQVVFRQKAGMKSNLAPVKTLPVITISFLIDIALELMQNHTGCQMVLQSIQHILVLQPLSHEENMTIDFCFTLQNENMPCCPKNTLLQTTLKIIRDGQLLSTLELYFS